MVGRNELCPCGSGRKYKKCCLEKDRAKDIARNRVKIGETQLESVIQKLAEFSSQYDKVYRNKCEIDFGVSNYELENLMNVYYLANYRYNKQSSIMLDYFNKNKQNISKNDEEIIENTLNSYMSIYQVKEKDINKVLLRDILLNEDVYVEDIDLFSVFKVGESLLARIVTVGDTKIFLDKTVKINESRKIQIKNDIDNRYKQTKKKCKTKKQCLINNIKFMYQNLITVRREYIVETPCNTVESNIEQVLNKTVVNNDIKSIPQKNEKQKERELKLLMVQQREKEIAEQTNIKDEKVKKPVVQHGEKEIILEFEEHRAQKTKEKIKRQIALPIVQLIKKEPINKVEQSMIQQVEEEYIKEVEPPIVQQTEKEIIIDVEQPTAEYSQEEVKETNQPVSQEIIDTRQEMQEQQPELVMEKGLLEIVMEEQKPELLMEEESSELVIKQSENEVVWDIDDEGVVSLVQEVAIGDNTTKDIKVNQDVKVDKEEQDRQSKEEHKKIEQKEDSELVSETKQRKQVMARKSRNPEKFKNRKRVNKRLEAKLKQRIETTKKLEVMRVTLELIRQEKLIKDRELKLREKELQLEKQLAKISLEQLNKESEKEFINKMEGKEVINKMEGQVKNKDCNVEIKNNDSPNKIETIPIYKAEQIESKIENISMSKIEQQIESKIENNIVAKLMVKEPLQEKKQEEKNLITDTQEIKIKQDKAKQDKTKQDKTKKQHNKNKSEEEQCKIYDILMLKVEDKYKDKCVKAWKQFKKIHKSYKGSENGWAAAIEYYVIKNIDDAVTQEQISKKYDISARTLGKRYKELQIS
ncbi:SEC-C metal-binding domain-containing protein [Intestinibacter sp.]